jgi:primosomal protein N' (replication factor Y)
MSDRQRSLFETDPAPWEVDDRAQQAVATIVFSEGPQGEFDYLIPPEFREADNGEQMLEPGRRVEVPLGRGNRRITGYCVAVELKSSGRRLKQVLAVLDPARLLSSAMLRLARWMADYYICPLGQVLDGIIPAGVRHQAGTREVKLLSVPTQVLAQMTKLKLPKKQAEVLQLLATSAKPLTATQVAAQAECTVGPVNSLRKKGLVEESVVRVASGSSSIGPNTVARQVPHDLSDDQKVALERVLGAMHAREHQTLLIHGVTGSGKTEIYIRAMEEAVSFGRQAIVLVPEISLTPQTVARFRARFDRVAILHSHLSDVERHQHWGRIARGEVEVVVGARSAVFAPVPHLGMIILDEEHESTFKQEVAPRYHARDVARWRAREEGVPLVLGSATPSLESWQQAQVGEFQLVEMPRRVLARALPTVNTIDLRLQEHSRHSRGSISRPLAQAIQTSLHDGGQVILMLNRRGYSTHIQCPQCGGVVICPHCDMSLTFHRQTNSAICHYCEYEITAPSECPDCKFGGIRYSGLGTQKLEDEVAARFPDYVCVRMDTDTMRRPGSHQAALTAFREGEAQILLGTQMIAKGLDFPNVTLVGVINADTALHLPDFRAAERTFQLVTQVAGRTGRGEKGGQVVVQTFSPDHPAIVAATRHDYEAFTQQELPAREFAKYPPFASLVRIVFRGEDEQITGLVAEEYTKSLSRIAEAHDEEIRVRGPAPAPFAKLRGCYRFHLQMQSTNVAAIRQIVFEVAAEVKLPDKVTWTIDVDPVDML